MTNPKKKTEKKKKWAKIVLLEPMQIGDKTITEIIGYITEGSGKPPGGGGGG